MHQQKCWATTALILVVLIASDHAARAQESVAYGLKVGVSRPTLQTDANVDFDARTVGIVGLFARVRLVGPVAVQPEVLFAPKGASVDREDGTDFTFKAPYLEVPLLIKLYPPLFEAFAPNVFAGPTVGVKLYERQGISNSDFSANLPNDRTFFERTNVGAAVGAGASFGAADGRIIVDLRYTFGFTDVARSVEPVEGTPDFPEEAEHRALTLMLSFQFQ